jgi:hypothetical protein
MTSPQKYPPSGTAVMYLFQGDQVGTESGTITISSAVSSSISASDRYWSDFDPHRCDLLVDQGL